MNGQPSPGAAAREILLDWYGGRAAGYPWRRTSDPYAVLVSEVMLQQTQASRVAPAFESFLDRFPSVQALAGASRADVVRAWGGLGYVRRAVALHEAARMIVRDRAGRVPTDVADLTALPGVGPYTASAVASIAFGATVAAIDTNVRRVTARYLRGVEPDEARAETLAADAQAWVHPVRPGDWNQALMDLGREFCRPSPRCDACPIAQGCRFASAGRRGRSSTRRQPPFEGSLRQVRGRVVATLRERPVASIPLLAQSAGCSEVRIDAAVEGLARDGIVSKDADGGVRLARA
jgi:A/G-specific adenine glycosylase